jgi:hypothetical protein
MSNTQRDSTGTRDETDRKSENHSSKHRATRHEPATSRLPGQARPRGNRVSGVAFPSSVEAQPHKRADHHHRSGNDDRVKWRAAVSISSGFRRRPLP